MSKSCITCKHGDNGTCVIARVDSCGVWNSKNYDFWESKDLTKYCPECGGDDVQMSDVAYSCFCGATWSIDQKAKDDINHPVHYTQGKVECIEAMEASSTPEQFIGYLKNSVLKYIWRVGLKDDSLKDIKKAQWYLNRLVNYMEKK